MIYLSGSLSPKEIGNRLDIGLMLGFRPDGKFNGQGVHVDKCLWAADNNCFNNPDLRVDDYLSWLKSKQKYLENCIFATAPDVVGDAKETWKRSKDILPEIRKLGYAAAGTAKRDQNTWEIKQED